MEPTETPASSASPALAAWIDRLAAPSITPSGIAAAACGAAIGMALLEKALNRPAENQEQRARQEASVLNGLRQRVVALVAEDEEAWSDDTAAADLPVKDEPGLQQMNADPAHAANALRAGPRAGA